MQTLTTKKTEAEVKGNDPDAPEEPYKKTTLTNEPGLNRVAWDLRYAGARVIPKAKNDGGNPKRGPLVVPGTYTLKLAINGKVRTTELIVKPDPRVKVTPKVLDQQVQFALKLRGQISDLALMVIRLQKIRTQLESRKALLKGDARAAKVIKSAVALVERINTLEAKFHNPKAEVTYDILAEGARLYSKLTSLYEWAHDSDGPLTQGMREVAAGYTLELEELTREYRGVVQAVEDLNEESRAAGIPNVVVPKK